MLYALQGGFNVLLPRGNPEGVTTEQHFLSMLADCYVVIDCGSTVTLRDNKNCDPIGCYIFVFFFTDQITWQKRDQRY